jgi:hypothetical protein
VFSDDVVFSNNQRFVLFVALGGDILVADLESDTPLQTTKLDSLTPSFNQNLFVVGDWIVWKNKAGALKGAVVADAVGAPALLSPVGESVVRVGVDPHRARVLFGGGEGQIWMRDLSSTLPSPLVEFPRQLPADLKPAMFALPSPVDDWVFYSRNEGFGSPREFWGHDLESDGGRPYFAESTGYVSYLLAPGVGWVEDVF